MYVTKKVDMTDQQMEGQIVIGIIDQRDCNGGSPDRSELAWNWPQLPVP